MGGADSGRTHEGTDGRREPRATQETARRKVSCDGTDGERSHGGILCLTDRGETGKCGNLGRVQWTERPGKTDNPGYQGGDVVMSGQGGARVPEDCGTLV